MFGSSSAISTRFVIVHLPPCATGIVNENVAPRPGSLATHSSPPNCRTISREIGSPRPVPCGRSVSVSPTCRNFSKIAPWCSAAIPMPLSATSTRTAPAASESATRTRPAPGAQNFTALASRFSSTCCSRSRSATTIGTRSGTSVSSCTLRSRYSAAVESAASRTTARRSTGSAAHSARPDSIFARSRIWLISRVSRSVSRRMMPTNSCRFAAASSGLSWRISANARIDVSGVRSSWLTVDTKSSFMRSSSRRRSFAARSSAVAASSSWRLRSSSREYASTWEVSSRMLMTSSIPSPSSFASDATAARAEADPMAPASWVSANCTSSASARNAPIGTPLPRRELLEQRGGPVPAEEAPEQTAQIVERRLAAPCAHPLGRPAKDIDEADGLRLLARTRRHEQRHDDERAAVGEHAPDHAVGDLVEAGQAEQRERLEEGDAPRPVRDESRR